MRLVLEHSGAQRGCLLLVEGGELWPFRRRPKSWGRLTQVSLTPALAVSATTLPLSILSYVRRTREPWC